MKNITEIPMSEVVPEGSVEIVRMLRDPQGRVTILLAARQEEADPGGWGLLAVDLLRHVANMMDGIGLRAFGARVSKEQILARMKELFDAEWVRPTTEIRGQRRDN